MNDKYATDATIASIAKTGADAVKAGDRLVYVSGWSGDSEAPTEVKVPYLFDGSGNPQPCKAAMDLARELNAREQPPRAGIYEMDDLDSLIRWAQVYKVPETTAIFVEAPSVDSDGKIIVVVDELRAGNPLGALRLLRCEAKLRLHDRLCAWLRTDQHPMNIEQFGDFAARAVEELSEAALISAISNVEVHEASKWVRSVDPESGAVKLTAESSKRTTKMPSSFRFAVPVFDGDDPANAQTFTARLIVRAPEGKPVFTFEIVDFKPRLAQAMATIRQQLVAVTEHVYMGSPG